MASSQVVCVKRMNKIFFNLLLVNVNATIKESNYNSGMFFACNRGKKNSCVYTNKEC
jgi:hypothetical protein